MNAKTLIERLESDDGWPSLRDARLALREGMARPDSISLARHLMDGGPARRADLAQRSLRIAVTSDASLDNLAGPLALALLERGLFGVQHHGAFGQIAMEVRDAGSALLLHKPELVVLAPLTEIWRRLDDTGNSSAESIANEAWSHVTSLRRHFEGIVLLQNMLPGEGRPHGIADPRRNPGHAELTAAVNILLSQRCRGTGIASLLDAAALAARSGNPWPGLHKQHFMAGRPLTDELARELAADIAAFCAARKGFTRKCLALDLDNTLWGGVVGEDGVSGLKIGGSYPGNLYTEIQRAIRVLHRRGVTLAVVSKNNEADAWEVFQQRPEMILRPEDFSAHRINWQDKAANLREIAAALNIGTDALVMIDDNPAERAWIAEALPEVEVCPHGDPLEILRWLTTTRLFDSLAISNEDTLRSKSYAAAGERAKLSSQSGGLEDYLASLGTEITVTAATGAQLARVAQLTQKTNQFNLSTRRYTETEIGARLRDPAWRVFVCSCRDRFADEGIIGAALVEASDEGWRLDTFLISCRVLGRDVERAFLSVIASDAAASGAGFIRGDFIPTAKNMPAADFYAKCGFRMEGPNPERSVWRLELPAPESLAPTWVKIHAGCASPSPHS